MSDSTSVFLEIFIDPPDPNEPLPFANRQATILGFIIAFMLISWCALFLRLYTRFFAIREPGWDDFFVVLACVSSTIGNICIGITVHRQWLGHHIAYIGIENMQKYFILYYVENGTYVFNCAFIKISLLIQYLRIFKKGTMRLICLWLLGTISLWGLVYSFMAWVPCFPVKGFWNRLLEPKCYGFGYGDKASFITTFETHTALNMVFDVTVYCVPLVLYFQPNLRRKQVLALTCLFAFGAIALVVAGWRIGSIVQHKAATVPYVDFTWWTPPMIILSSLEISIAVTCASMPIFWPVLEQWFPAIFVTTEVRVTEHRRIEENGLEYELQHRQSANSLKSTSAESQDGLTRNQSVKVMEVGDHYKDQYVLEHADPLRGEALGSTGIETNVNSDSNKSKWMF